MKASAIILAREICERFEIALRTDPMGNLVFDYSTGQSEYFGLEFHTIPTSGGHWASKSIEPNLIREIFVCRSAMEAIAFLHFNAHRYHRQDGLLFLAISPRYVYPVELSTLGQSVKVNLLFGTDVLDVLRCIKFCLDFKAIKVCFYLEDELIQCIMADKTVSIHQKRISVRKFFSLSRVRPFFRQYKPKTYTSFLNQFINQ